MVFLVVFAIAGLIANADNGSNGNLAGPVPAEMVPGAVSDDAAVHRGHVGNHRSV